jgi:hypothetical protein
MNPGRRRRCLRRSDFGAGAQASCGVQSVIFAGTRTAVPLACHPEPRRRGGISRRLDDLRLPWCVIKGNDGRWLATGSANVPGASVRSLGVFAASG